MGKGKGKHRRCGLCGDQCPDTVRLRLEADTYSAAYDNSLVPVIFEEGEKFSKGPKDGYNGCHGCLEKHLRRLGSIGSGFEAQKLQDAM